MASTRTEEEFIRLTIGLIANVIRELTAVVGRLNAGEIDSDEQKALSTGLDELYALTTRITEAFPPPPLNGGNVVLH